MAVVGLVMSMTGRPTVLLAQERLLGKQSAGIGASFESITFSGDGLRQYNFAGFDSARVTSVRQVSTPITTAWAIGSGLHVDVTALYASATVNYRDAGNASRSRSATLSGISDLRVRATASVVPERLVVTAGINAPTGRTALTTNEFGVLRIMAAPALGLGSTPVGAGASGTMGLVAARRLGPWAIALGGSYEYRGKYQPVAALVAGAPSADFRPGGVVRASITGDRTVGQHRLSVALAADIFSDDELKTPATSGGTGGAPAPSSSTIVRLGPVYSTDVQMQFAAPRFRQLLGYAAVRVRAPFSRDGTAVAKSGGQYLDAGMRGALALGVHRDLILGVDTRLHSGLGVDEGLPTSGVASGSVSVGVEFRRGLLSLQPYARAQGGVLRQRGAPSSVPSQAFTGYSTGLVVVGRF